MIDTNTIAFHLHPIYQSSVTALFLSPCVALARSSSRLIMSDAMSLGLFSHPSGRGMGRWSAMRKSICCWTCASSSYRTVANAHEHAVCSGAFVPPMPFDWSASMH